MRYIFAFFGLCTVVVMLIAGKRGDLSRREPIEIFPDMNRQPKLRPQVPNEFFGSGRSSQLPVVGTIAREDMNYADIPMNTGKETGTTNFVENIPVPVTRALLERGQQRFNINCSPCHGEQGDGKGITVRVGAMPPTPKNLHDKAYIVMKDGELFNTISNGKGLMGPYGANVTVEDRWAIIAYVRALQLSQLGTIDDVPEQNRSTLKK